MRPAIIVFCLLTACVAVPPSQNPTPQQGPQAQQIPTQRVSRSSQQLVENYQRIGRQIEAVAEPLCRQKNPTRPAKYCDFQVRIDTSRTNAPNAFQTIGKDGRPIIAFNIPMLATVKNNHEIAFILGHEAGHQISSHIVQASTNANIGALVLGGIFALSGASASSVVEAQNLGGTIGARAYSQTHELEADVVGTYVAHLAGYDPVIGARSFSRIGAGGGGFLSTHPPTNQRMQTVQRTIQQIAAKRAAGLPIRLP